MLINNYNDFVSELLRCGFTIAGPNDEGVFSLSTQFSNNICWHTELPDTDPWEWRMRILNERTDIAYSKLFFNKSGYITKEWYPYFLAVRRQNKTLKEDYFDGNISSSAKKIYGIIESQGALPAHILKKMYGINKENKSSFERGLLELMKKLYITICGNSQKLAKNGNIYGWSSTVYCRSEEFFQNNVFETAAKLKSDEAYDIIEKRILMLNPHADHKKITKFIMG